MNKGTRGDQVSDDEAGFDLKRTYVYLKHRGIDFNGITYDMMLASYILNPSLKNNNFDIVCEHFEYTNITYDEDIYQKGNVKEAKSNEDLYKQI